MGYSIRNRNQNFIFTRVSSGSEFEFGDTRVIILAPSVDLRNRFDTFGVEKNDASIVLRIKYRNSYVIIAADAQYASWGKVTEEFPRHKAIKFNSDALGLAQRKETSDQLKCNLLRISHHGSKHGSSLEYLERLDPAYVIISAGSEAWYQANDLKWAGYFPHPLVKLMLKQLDPTMTTLVTGEVGNIIVKYHGRWSPREVKTFNSYPRDPGFAQDLRLNWP